MLEKIAFENYKTFKERGELEIRPITVLIGKNSSGKSALAKLPTLLENSLNGYSKEAILLNNNGVELGTEFRDIVYARQVIGDIFLGVDCKNKSLNVKVAADSRDGEPKVVSWQLNTPDKSYNLLTENFNFNGFIPEIDDLGLADTERLTVEHALDSFKLVTDYVGPFRIRPKKIYDKPKPEKKIRIGIEGENAYNLLISDALSTEQNLLKAINAWYEQNFDGWKIGINTDRAPYYEVEFVKDNLEINLTNVGQGISQALPLAVRALMKVEEETLIIMEQPELHLHPAAHGNLAELFVQSLEKENKRYLIETHSKNFVLRLRRLIAEQKYNYFTASDIVIYSVEFDENSNSSKIKKIEVDDLGNVNYWPKGVFSESLDETIAIRSAQLEQEEE